MPVESYISPKFQLQEVAPEELSVNCTKGFRMLVDAGAENAATGTAFTVIILVLVADDTHPAAEVVVSDTEYCPGVVKQCEAGLPVALPPSLNDQDEEAIVPPPATVELFVKFTHNGAQPEVTSLLKITTGKGKTVTVTESTTAGEHPSFAVTVYVVVTTGFAVGLLIAALLNPVEGDHE